MSAAVHLGYRAGFSPREPGPVSVVHVRQSLWRRGARIVGRPLRWGLRASVLTLFARGVSATNPSPAAPVWPPPPAEPRIIYVRNITSPADLGIKRPVLSRVAGWITGASADSAQFVKPFGVALDDAGNLLVTDTGANVACCLDRARKKWLRWQQAGKTRFECPVAIARRGNTAFVADSVLAKVFALDEKGKLLFEITRELERPSGLAVAGDRLFIADAQRHQVVVCSLRGEFISKFGRRGSGPGELNFPTHLAVDSESHLLVTDSLNCRIQVFDASGRCLRGIGSAGDGPGHFSRPKGVAVDALGHIYVVDAVFDNVQLFDDQGRLLMTWGEGGSNPGQFWLPNGIAIGRDNQIYVADSYNRRIQVFSYTGKP
jgi:sugar lactone lactonase YvrE